MPEIHRLGIFVPDLKVPRAEPCEAFSGGGNICGATPASLYRKSCGVPSHTRHVWLCGTHANMISCGAGSCHDCAIRFGVARVYIFRVSEPLRLG